MNSFFKITILWISLFFSFTSVDYMKLLIQQYVSQDEDRNLSLSCHSR